MKDLIYYGGIEGVTTELPFFDRLYQAGLSQQVEMMGDAGFGNGEVVGYLCKSVFLKKEVQRGKERNTLRDPTLRSFGKICLSPGIDISYIDDRNKYPIPPGQGPL